MPPVAVRLVVVVALGWIGAPGPRPALADPPRVTATTPAGACRGVATEVTIAGVGLVGRPRWLGAFAAEVEAVAPPAGPPGDGTSWRVRITPGADVPVGVHVVRIATDDGLSNPFPFAVDQVPQVAEVEDNGPFGRAQRVEAPVVVEGQASGNDVDSFRFAGRRGDRVVVDALCARIGSGVDPAIRLSTAARRLIADADDTPGLITDARLCAELPEDGDYVVELSDTRYQGAGPRTHYRLLIGPGVVAATTVFPLGGRRGSTVRLELAGGTLAGPAPRSAELALGRDLEAEPGRIDPQIAAADLGPSDPVPSGGWWARAVVGLPPLAVGDAPEYAEPTDPAAPPMSAPLPAVFNGRIDPAGDRDTFRVAVAPGQKVRVVVVAAALGSHLDGVLQVRGANDAVLASDDDSALPAGSKLPPADPKRPAILSVDPEAVVTVPAGTTEIAVALRDLNGDGGPAFPYRITVEPVVPGFLLRATTADQANIPRGGTVGIGVEVERRDFGGPIAVTVADPPPGVTVRPGSIPAGQTLGALTLSADAAAAFEPTTLRVVATAAGPAGPIVAEATRTTILARQADFATGYFTRAGLPAAPTSPAPITLAGPDGPVAVVLGYPAAIPVRATRSPGASDVVLTLGSLPTVANLAVGADAKLGAGAVDGAIPLTTTADLPAGPIVVVPTARGKFGDRDRTIAAPAVTLDVARPAEVDGPVRRVEVIAGASAEARGQVVRRGPCREPIAVRLDGLPPGLRADPAVVPPGETDFAVRIVADPRAAPIEATARVVLALKIGPRDYAPPPVPLPLKVVPAP